MSNNINYGSAFDRAKSVFSCPSSTSIIDSINLIGALLLSISENNNFGITGYASQEFTYIGGGSSDDDRVETITYKDSNDNTIAVLTFTYYGSTNNIQTITKS